MESDSARTRRSSEPPTLKRNGTTNSPTNARDHPTTESSNWRGDIHSRRGSLDQKPTRGSQRPRQDERTLAEGLRRNQCRNTVHGSASPHQRPGRRQRSEQESDRREAETGNQEPQQTMGNQGKGTGLDHGPRGKVDLPDNHQRGRSHTGGNIAKLFNAKCIHTCAG